MTRRTVSSRPTAVVQESRDGLVDRRIVEVAHRGYARLYPSSAAQQDVDRILERGGFSWAEIVAFLWIELKDHGRGFDELVSERPPGPPDVRPPRPAVPPRDREVS